MVGRFKGLPSLPMAPQTIPRLKGFPNLMRCYDVHGSLHEWSSNLGE